MSLTIHYKYPTFVFVNVQASKRASPQKAQFLEFAIHELACCTRNNFISVFVVVEQSRIVFCNSKTILPGLPHSKENVELSSLFSILIACEQSQKVFFFLSTKIFGGIVCRDLHKPVLFFIFASRRKRAIGLTHAAEEEEEEWFLLHQKKDDMGQKAPTPKYTA